MKTNYKNLLLMLLFVSSMAFSQQTVLMDLGGWTKDWPAPAPYNNPIENPKVAPSNNIDLLNDQGVASGFKFEVTQAFQNVIGAGAGYKDNPVATGDAAVFHNAATIDNFYTKGGAREVGIITLSGLDNAKYYSFELFASYFDPKSTNRESKITITGSAAEVGYIDAQDNSTTTVHINNIKPVAGKVTIQLEVGPNNTTIYAVLNAFKMRETTNTVLAVNEATSKEGLHIYPNPVDDTLNIDYMLHSNGVSSISVYDITGRKVSKITNNDRSGTYTFKWNRTDNNGVKLNPGVYFLKLETEKGTYSKRLILK